MKGSIRLGVFYGFLLVVLVSVIGITSISYMILRETLENQNAKKMQSKVEALMVSLDYAVSHTTITEKDVSSALERKILEISDIHNKDIVIYDLAGNYLLSNKKKNLVLQQKIPEEIIKKLVQTQKRYDLVEYEESIKSNVTSSYIYLMNNILEPIAIVYFPFYHNDSAYVDVFQSYFKMMTGTSIFLLALGVWLSWFISYSLTENIRSISEEITKINLNGNLDPIKYHNDDEFTPLINSYNRTLRLIEEQRNLLAFREKESAWREMAKQVAHEVKNPLTPMKLLIQNFERKFDKEDPKIEGKVKRLCASVIDQIDLIAKVANAFSEFTKLPEKKDEIININDEIQSLIRVFDERQEIETHFNRANILIRFDKVFFQRIMSNLILNAQQARDDERKFHLFINVELLNKKVIITLRDNGIGIAKNKMDKIFEPNFTTKTSGTGLGLTMVKRMIEEYKGEISIRSEEGKGTLVRVTLLVNV